MNRAIGRNGKRRGSTMLEFAIGAGVLLAAFTGTFQFGYTFFQYNRLTNAVDAGARYAAQRPYDSANTSPSSDFLTAVRNMVVYGNPAGGSTPVVQGLQPQHVQLTVQFVNAVPAFMSVEVHGYTINAVMGAIQCNHKPKVTHSYLGVWMPY